MKKIKCLFAVVILVLVFSSCLSSPSANLLDSQPNSEMSSLIYGYFELDTEKDLTGQLSCFDWESFEFFTDLTLGMSDEQIEELILSSDQGEKIFMIMMNGGSSGAWDSNTGVFIIQVPGPGDYVVADIVMTELKNRIVYSYTYLLASSPAEEKDAINLEGGDMAYWGAIRLSITDEKEMDGDIEVHPTITRAEVFGLVEEMIAGQGWDAWLAAERSQL